MKRAATAVLEPMPSAKSARVPLAEAFRNGMGDAGEAAAQMLELRVQASQAAKNKVADHDVVQRAVQSARAAAVARAALLPPPRRAQAGLTKSCAFDLYTINV